ncbi:hypothetical protein [Calothrix sp. UHCC 0171]|uniref:hypothetical protein n=1 Tax=Calothrix sp. UHCC 0171 TaxID=3110245 RepID=UPI002B221136|nr:hypothetical protein [Calothrix sp. UHCC 0171]MEA5572753.1 hypothetical protein [Calothrix sp. UHCC 0171]
MIAITQDFRGTDNHTESNLERQIKIKKMQLKIAQEGNMPCVIEAIRSQLEELERLGCDSQQDSDFHALMSLLDD